MYLLSGNSKIDNFFSEKISLICIFFVPFFHSHSFPKLLFMIKSKIKAYKRQNRKMQHFKVKYIEKVSFLIRLDISSLNIYIYVIVLFAATQLTQTVSYFTFVFLTSFCLFNIFVVRALSKKVMKRKKLKREKTSLIFSISN